MTLQVCAYHGVPAVGAFRWWSGASWRWPGRADSQHNVDQIIILITVHCTKNTLTDNINDPGCSLVEGDQ